MKTIEECASEYAKSVDYPAPDYNWYESDDEQMQECLANAFIAGANHVMSLPLADRLTAEVRETIIKLHIAATSGTSEFGRGYSAALERIFGTELFAKKGGSHEKS